MKFRLNEENCFYMYFVLMLAVQLLEMVASISISKFVMLLFLMTLFFIFWNREKVSKRIVAVLLSIAVLCVTEIAFNNSVLEQAIYILYTVFILFLLSQNMNKLTLKSYRLLKKIIWGYLFINLFLWLAKYSPCLQAEGSLRYKGAFPHANLFANSIFAILLLFIYEHHWIDWLLKLLLLYFLVISGSRTYLFCSILLIFIIWFWENKNSRMIKSFFLIFSALPFIIVCIRGFQGINLFSSNPFQRYIHYGFASNGRDLLIKAFSQAYHSSSQVKKILGYGLGEEYLKYSPTHYGHSFSENSYLAFLVIFGISGALMLVMIIVMLFKMCHYNMCNMLCTTVVLISCLTQDTILSTQAAICLFGALFVSYNYMAQNPIKKSVYH